MSRRLLRPLLPACLAVFAYAVPSRAAGQAVPAPPLRDGQRAAGSMEQVVQFVTATAFRGVTLSDDQRASAREIIIKAVQEQQRLDTAHPSFIAQRQVIVDRRREALRALVTSDRDRTRFDENYAALEP